MTDDKADHFSSVAQSYAAFRPTYPAELFKFVASIAPARHCVWECGAGSGQATIGLAAHFDRVIATDVSAEQLSRAPENAKVGYIVASAERVPIASDSVDLVAVAQAMHWFDFERFYAECRRVARKEAVLVAWTYGSPSMDREVGVALRDFMYGPNAIGPYWPPERDYITKEYRTIPFPFERIASPRLELVQEWGPEQVVGYLRSMSATSQYIKRHGTDPVPAFETELSRLWPNGEARRIWWPLIILAGKIA